MKYKLTDESITVFGVELRRIEAVADFGDIKAGQKGGFVQAEYNLDQSGEAWVYGEAQVYGEARVYGEAQVRFDTSEIEYVVLSAFGEHYRSVTATKQTVYCGCFVGRLAAFKAAVINKYGENFGGAKGYANCILLLSAWMDEA